MTNNSINSEYANVADGFELAGGTTKRKLKVTGADVTLTGTGTNIFTFPTYTSTLETTVTLVNTQTNSYTLALTDCSKLVYVNNASANTLTIPPNSSVAFPIGTRIVTGQYGAGQTTLTPGAGVTIRSAGAKLKLNVQYSIAHLIKIGTDEWQAYGDLIV